MLSFRRKRNVVFSECSEPCVPAGSVQEDRHLVGHLSMISIGVARIDVPTHQVSHNDRDVELTDDGFNNGEHLCNMIPGHDVAVTQRRECNKAEVQQFGFKVTTGTPDIERVGLEEVHGVKYECPNEAKYDEEVDGSEDLGSGHLGTRYERLENKNSAEDEKRKAEKGHCQAQGSPGKQFEVRGTPSVQYDENDCRNCQDQYRSHRIRALVPYEPCRYDNGTQ